MSYETTCVKMSSHKVDLRATTQKLTAEAAAHLERGMFVDIEHRMVTVAWASPTAKLPSIIFGVAVH